MRIGSYHVYDNATDYKDYWSSVASPPKIVTNIEGRRCYIVRKKNESDRVWVTYTTYYTYHYLYKNNMSEYREHNLRKKKD